MRISDWSSDVCSSDLFDSVETGMPDLALISLSVQPLRLRMPRITAPRVGGSVRVAITFSIPCLTIFQSGSLFPYRSIALLVPWQGFSPLAARVHDRKIGRASLRRRECPSLWISGGGD